MTCLYHLCARDFRGTTLYPLNRLRDRFPDLYQREREKFVGRESLLDYVVPGLNVTWADTVNLSALDPRRLLEERRALGVPFSRLLERRLVAIPVARVAALPAVNYVSKTHWINSAPGDPNVPRTPPEQDFSAFDAGSHIEVCVVPAEHREYLLRQKARGELALGFVFVPHVLVAGPIDIAGLPMIEMLI